MSTKAGQLHSVFDNVAPTVAISGVPATTNAPFTATFTFSKPVTGLAAGGIGVANGTLSNLVSTGANTYTATVTPTAPGTVTITVPAGGAHDVSGNLNAAATPASTVFDNVAPSVVISGVPASTNGPFTTTFTFGKPVSGFAAGGIGVANGTLSNLVSTGPNTYTATITPTSPGTVTITVPAGGAHDALGNLNAAATPVSTVLDTSPLSVAITDVPAATNGPFVATFTFNKPVSGFGLAGIVPTNGTLSDFVMVSPNVFRVLVTPTAKGTITLNVPPGGAHDLSGNMNMPAPPAATVFDTIAPTVAISGVPATTTGPFTATFTFSKGVTGFTAGGVTLGNGTLSNFVMVSPNVYTALVSPTANGVVTIDVAGGVAQDLAGNKNTAAAQAKTSYMDKGSVRARTQAVIGNFMAHRADQITASDPELVQRLTRDGLDNFAGMPLSLTGNGGGDSNQIQFATSLRQILEATQSSVVREAERTGHLGFGQQKGSNSVLGSPLDIWAAGKFSNLDSGGSQNTLGLLYLGADYRINPGFLVGVLGQFDWSHEKSAADQTRADGQGWMVGPYFVARLDPKLYLDGRVSIGQSSNSVSPFGTYSDSFDASRWLARSRLVGDFNYDELRLRPEVGLVYFEETQHGYVDSQGVEIPGHTVSLGRLNFGPEFSTEVRLNSGIIVNPRLKIEGIWDFDKAGTVDVATGLSTGSAGLRGRIETGVSILSLGGTSFGLDGFYDGIGADDYKAKGGTARLKVPLN